RKKAKDKGAKQSLGRVLLLDDCFTTFNEPDIGRAAVRVLEGAGFPVELANLTCCGRPMISKGFLQDARNLIHAQVPRLLPRIAGGIPLLGLEPSCLLTLSDEWPELLPGPATRQIAAAADLADRWLAKQVAAGHCDLRLVPRKEKCLVHGHCHQKALLGIGGAAEGSRPVARLDAVAL